MALSLKGFTLGLFLLLAMSTAGIAQDRSADPWQKRITELEALEAPDADQKAELAELASAVAFRARARASAERTKKLLAEKIGTPDRLASLKEEVGAAQATLEKPADLGIPPVPSGAPVEEMEAALSTVEARLAAAKAQWEAAQGIRDAAAAAVTEHAARAKTIPGELAQVSRRRQEVLPLSAAFAPDAELSALDRAKKENLKAEAESLAARETELGAELETGATTKILRETLVTLAAARATAAKRIVDALQEEIDQRRTQIAAFRSREAEAARREGIRQHPVVKEILDRNAELAAELTDKVARPRRDRNEQRREISEVLAGWEESLEKIQGQIARVGLNSVIGSRLRTMRARLADIGSYQRQADEVGVEAERAHTRSIQLEDDRIKDPAAAAERRIAASETPVPEAEYDEILAAATEGLREQQKHVEDLLNGYIDYADNVLGPLHEVELRLAGLLERIQGYIDQRFLWIRSTDPLSPRDLPRLGRSMAWLVDSGNWADIQSAWRRKMARPTGVFLLFVPFLALLVLRWFLLRVIAATAKKIERASTDRFLHTVRAVIATALLALTWPALIWGFSRMLADGPSEFVQATAAALLHAAFTLFAVAWLYHLCRPEGVGERHFRWSTDTVRLVRKHLRWLAAVGIPMSAIVVLTESSGFTPQRETLGRLAYCVNAVLVMLFTWWVLHPGRGIFHDALARNSGGWANRLRSVWFPLLVLLAPSFAVMACLGYFRTAHAMTGRLTQSIWLVLDAIIVSALVLRWLYSTQRVIALDELRQRIRTERDAAKSGEEEPSEEPPLPEDVELDMEEVGTHMKRLMRSIVAAFLVIGFYRVWAEVLPALGMFKEFVLWVPAGVEIQAGAIPAGAITAADVGIAAVILFLTIAVSRNMPGALEFLVLRHLPMTAGGRYTARTLTSYTILVVGIILTFNAIGIGWGKVQWLVAAVSVGLGFGLQEIFANFVSGLIILTERPVRIGDIVTVGDISGTITRIQMRATTVTDWDRKELIIPNRSFVTGQITNWTLSHALLRLNLPVGIAYGSDTEAAKHRLLQVAADDRRVLDHPASMALFMGFGDSSLNFELRVFIDDVDQYAVIRDGLNMAIDRTFRDAGIVIAFPQRDVNFRMIDGPPPEIPPDEE